VQYTAIGDTVNVAARLVNKAAGGEIIVSEAIRNRMPETSSFESLGEVDLKGRATKMAIYRLARMAP
jgi:class 3 adenylate cyclase